MPNGKLDDADRRILSLLQQDGSLTNADLSERVHLTPAPCYRRVKRLEKEGFIEGYRAILSRPALGLGLTIFIEIKFDGHRSENTVNFQNAMRRMPEVVSCHMISGDADYLVEMVVPDLTVYHRILTETLLKLPMVKDIRSNFTLQTVKRDAPLPLHYYNAR
jgi:Lrp/AsnC family leucine-responsive transcriptional regulator